MFCLDFAHIRGENWAKLKPPRRICRCCSVPVECPFAEAATHAESVASLACGLRYLIHKKTYWAEKSPRFNRSGEYSIYIEGDLGSRCIESKNWHIRCAPSELARNNPMPTSNIRHGLYEAAGLSATNSGDQYSTVRTCWLSICPTLTIWSAAFTTSQLSILPESRMCATGASVPAPAADKVPHSSVSTAQSLAGFESFIMAVT